MNIPQDTLDDFHDSICRNGFSKGDFEISYEDASIPNLNGIYVLRIKVTVKRKSNNITKVYQGGDATSWNMDFENDLQKGFFWLALTLLNIYTDMVVYSEVVSSNLYASSW